MREVLFNTKCIALKGNPQVGDDQEEDRSMCESNTATQTKTKSRVGV